jgi:ERF superfamily
MSDNLPEVAEPAPATMLALIERMAANPAVDIGKLQALLDMQERLENRQRVAEFNAAFARLQHRLPRITKKGEIKYDANPDAKTAAGRKGSSTAYARWEDIMDAILPHLYEEGFALTYDAPPGPDGRITCTATLIHRAGHSRSASFGPMPLDTSGGKNNLQAAGSTDSYGKRFATRDLLNLVYEGLDDDGVRGGMVFITQADIEQIETLIAETKSDRLRFLEYMGVSELGNIQLREKERALSALMQKKRPPPGTVVRGARDGSGESPAAAAAPPSTDLVTEVDRKLTEAAAHGKRALDKAWISMSPHEQDLARGRRQYYYDLATGKEPNKC